MKRGAQVGQFSSSFGRGRADFMMASTDGGARRRAGNRGQDSGIYGLRGLSGKAGQRRLSAQRSSVVGAQYLMVYRTIGPERDDVQNGTSSITEGVLNEIEVPI